MDDEEEEGKAHKKKKEGSSSNFNDAEIDALENKIAIRTKDKE